MPSPVRVLLLSIVAIAGTLAGGASARAQPAPAVPPEFRALYTALEAKLAQVERDLGSRPPAPANVTFTLELLTANSNRGETLLQPATLPATAQLLDRVQAMGVRGVMLSINYPLLTPDFPRSAEYVAFYKQVVGAVRQRGMTPIVETTTIFPDPEFSSIGVDYSGLTLERYRQGKRQMVETIIAELHPDYLTIESEPATITRNTGLAYSVEDYIGTINAVLDGLDRAGVRIGAGAGTWDSLDYFAAVARDTSVDNVDMHIYPIQGDGLFDKPLRIAELAHAAGKGVTVGESWLYKTAGGEQLGTPAAAVTVFGRDAFSFWAPLDQRFLTALTTIARLTQMEFCSSYWIQYLFAYVDYTEQTASLTYNQRAALLNGAAFRNIASGTLSATGEVYQQLIR